MTTFTLHYYYFLLLLILLHNCFLVFSLTNRLFKKLYKRKPNEQQLFT